MEDKVARNLDFNTPIEIRPVPGALSNDGLPSTVMTWRTHLSHGEPVFIAPYVTGGGTRTEVEPVWTLYGATMQQREAMVTSLFQEQALGQPVAQEEVTAVMKPASQNMLSAAKSGS